MRRFRVWATRFRRRNERSGAHRALTTGLVLTITLVAFESLAVATVMPVISDDLDGLQLYGWVFSAFFLGSILGIVVAGQSTDRRGPAAPFAAGLVLFAAGLVVAGLAPTMGVLVGARVAQGFGAGAIPAVAYVAIGRGYPESARPRMFAILATAWVVPGLAGPALSALVADHVGWRAVFLGLLPLVLVAGGLTWPALARLVPAPPHDRAGRPDHADGAGRAERSRLPDALRVAAGAGAVLAGLSGRRPLSALLVVAGAVVAVPALGRLVPAGTARARAGLPAAVLTRGILTFAFFGADAYVPLALTSVRGTSVTFAGVAVTAATLSWTTGAWLQERWLLRGGARRLVRSGLGLVLLGIVGAGAMLSEAVPVGAAVVAWSVAGLGIGLAYAPLSVTTLAEARPGREGQATSALQLSDMLGVALGTGVGGAIVALGDAAGWHPGTGIALAFVVAGSAGAVGVAAARSLPGPRDQRPESADVAPAVPAVAPGP